MRRLVFLIACALGLSACPDKDAEHHLTALLPRVTAVHDKLRALLEALPPIGQEHEQACAPRLAATELHTLDVDMMEYMLDMGPLPMKRDGHARSMSGSALVVPSPRQLTRDLHDGSAFAVEVDRLEKHLTLSEQVTHVVVLRTEAYDSGAQDERIIHRPASFTGWVFVMSVSPAQVIGAWHLDVKGADRIADSVSAAKVQNFVWHSLDYHMSLALNEASQRLCGITVNVASEKAPGPSQ